MKIEHHPGLREQIIRHEGLSLSAYRCPAGALTIGYGHNLDARPIWDIQEDCRISRAMADSLLRSDLKDTAERLDTALPWWRSLNEPRQAVILNMAYQMGVGGLLKFRRTLAAVQAGDWDNAAQYMLESKWARNDSPKRAIEMAEQMKTGKWLG